MSTDLGSSAARRRGRFAGLVITATLALSLASVVPAWASGPTATLAPIGTGSYLLTVTTGAEKLEHDLGLIGENLTNFALTEGTCFPQPLGALCEFKLPAMTSKQICYSGGALTDVEFNLIEVVTPRAHRRWRHARCRALPRLPTAEAVEAVVEAALAEEEAGAIHHLQPRPALSLR